MSVLPRVSPRRRPQLLVESLEGRVLLASISGHIFYDLNGNGIQDSGENGAFNATQTIFLDQNDNGAIDTGEPFTSLDSLGNYSFSSLAPGTYRVRLQQDPGYLRTAPSTDSSLVTITGTQDIIAPAFGVTQSAQISGIVFNDANGNSVQDSNEPALPKATAFLDLNSNSAPDSATASFASINVPRNAPGLIIVASNISVTGTAGLVLDVNVTANVTSANDNAPELYLENPQGVRVMLVTPADTTSQTKGHNFTNTIFDDQAPKTIAQGVAPFTSSFQTSGSLRGFGLNQLNNVSANGTWRLILADTSTANTATLTGWSLAITTGDPQTQTDFSGNYHFPNVWPGNWPVRAAKTNFATTSPTAVPQYNLTLKATDSSLFNNFGLRELITTNNTATFTAPTNLNHLTQNSPFTIVQSDFNKDGKLDLATANNGSNDVSIYLGNGNGTFKDPVFYSVGASPRGIAVANLNKDGSPDLVVANHDAGTLSVLLGNGNGTFKPQQTFAAGSGACSIAIADFDGDSKLDLAVADQLAPTMNILTGIGDGTFNTAVPITVGPDPVSIKAADINKDNKQDLVVANDADGTITVLLGNGNGTFGAPIDTPVGNNPVSINVTDLNADGKQDVIVANAGDNDMEVLLGKNNGTFTQPTTFGKGFYTTGETPAAVNLGDFNKDNRTDIIVSDRGDGLADISGDLRIYLGNGDGTLQPPFILTTHTSPVFVATGDFNKDGKIDIAAANFLSNDISVLLNTTTPATTAAATYSISGSVFSDNNANAAPDTGENGISNVTVYVDSNNDKIFQSTEPHATTTAAGTYTIAGLPPSNPAANPPYYVVRQVIPAGYTQTLPGGGLGGHVTITNANVSNINFGDKPPATASTSGLVYNDTNGNGKQDAGETGVPNRVIYIDTNHDGLLDNSEPSTTTDSDGNWTLSNLLPGIFRIREQNTLNIQHTQPISSANYYDITLTPGQTDPTPRLFGERASTLSPTPLFQISAGATADFIASNGITNLADTGFTGGTATTTIYDVAGTDNDPIYYNARTGANFSYTFNVPNGNYKLILLFADPTKTAAGERIFNVTAQGNTILSNFDIVATARPKTAVVKNFNISVTTGTLTLQFASTVDQAIISGIQLVPA